MNLISRFSHSTKHISRKYNFQSTKCLCRYIYRRSFSVIQPNQRKYISDNLYPPPMEDIVNDSPLFDAKRNEQVKESERLYLRELELENLAIEKQAEKYRKTRESLEKIGKAQNMGATRDVLADWFPVLTNSFKEEQDKMRKAGPYKSHNYETVFLSLPADKIAIITMHEALRELSKAESILYVRLSVVLGDSIQKEYIKMLKVKKYTQIKKERKLMFKEAKNNGIQEIDYTVLNKNALTTFPKLTHEELGKIGGILLYHLIENCKFIHQKKEIPAFLHELQVKKKNQLAGMVRCHPAILQQIEEQHDLRESLHTRFMPMVIKPKPWTDYNVGGFLTQEIHVLRSKGSNMQLDVLKRADLDTVYKALNILGSVPWVINKPVHKVVKEIWDNGGGLGELPPRDNLPLPEEKDYEDIREFKKAEKMVRIENANRHSLRSDMMLKLEQCEELYNDVIYYPYNMDFRGRVYPIPPHLNHIGSDLCRGLLTYAYPKKLGERGLFWLRLQIANLFGKDKLPQKERFDFVEDNMKNIIDSAEKPLAGSRWWLEGDDPWQLLATCIEYRNALKLKDPTQYESSLPIHQDGSCNGLQHYAALGRDEYGASQVNLIAGDRPADVYTGVLKHVVAKVESDLQSEDIKKKKFAQLLEGGKLLTRKVIKQTVMTSVYGVTFVGARQQIQNQLKALNIPSEKLKEYDLEDLYGLSLYVTQKTMDSLGEVNKGAHDIMLWLNNCASLVSKTGYPMMWITPLGLPIVQPYRKMKKIQILTMLQNVTFAGHEYIFVYLYLYSDSAPVLPQKQRSAFPPNFVHSLDSTHMMMTAIECYNYGLQFASVHDSYWTYACDVDILNRLLREQFVKLYSQPILENFLESQKLMHPNIQFPSLPQLGKLDLNCVKKSIYFFN